ncbi:MAG: hypothetical protein KZQ90_12850 [Candidatus Thiodiazotropha sp. (ex Codakia rugifera)]|nr:hypothetical protein [Candidatus Thiodiazotropha sp. (ex Codakia rugifera)]
MHHALADIRKLFVNAQSAKDPLLEEPRHIGQQETGAVIDMLVQWLQLCVSITQPVYQSVSQLDNAVAHEAYMFCMGMKMRMCTVETVTKPYCKK